MKKILIVLASALSFAGFSQSSIQVIDDTHTVTLGSNDTLYLTTDAELVTTVLFDLKNIGTTTNIYKVTREDLLLNTGASAYFCFAGSCYPDFTMTSPEADTLNPGQKASALAGSYKMLTTDLQEGLVVSKSIIKYTVFNVNNANDKMSFVLKYNYPRPVGIKETNRLLSSFEIFPNPAKESSSILVSSPNAFESSVVIFNSLGQAVYQKEVHISEGKNKIDMNLENLKSGVYFASIKTANTTISKKLIITN